MRVWVDAEVATSELPEETYGQLKDELKGTMVFGLHADANYLELTGYTFGFKPTENQTKAGLLENMPADTNVALEMTGLGDTLTGLWESIPENDPAKLRDYTTQTGLDLPTDFTNILGEDFAVYANINSDPQGAVSAITPDPQQSVATIQKLAKLGEEYGIDTKNITTNDNGYTVGTNPEWAKTNTPTGNNLGETDEFKTAVPDADNATSFLYVNISSLTDSIPETKTPETDPFEAFGMSVSNTNNEQTKIVARVTLKD